jgi:hypothetical protein
LWFYFKIGASAPCLLPYSIKMALIGNKLYRDFQNKQEEAADIDQLLARMEDDIRKLKIDFDIFFNGANKRPPLEARARLESFIKRIADNRNLTYAQRYYFNTLVSRFTSYRELWRRTLKAKGEEFV